MKHLSLQLLAETVVNKRREMKLSQEDVSEKTDISCSVLSKLESGEYSPTVDELLSLASFLDFNINHIIEKDDAQSVVVPRKKIAIAGTGYVGLSLAVLLAQNNDVTAVDIVPEKVEKINNWRSPIQDDYIEKYMSEHEERKLSLKATTDAESTYKDADFIVIATPTNYDPKTNFFDCSAVENVLRIIKTCTSDKDIKPTIIIKSTIRLDIQDRYGKS